MRAFQNPTWSVMSEVEKLIEQGQRSLEKGDFKGAMSKFNKALKLDPENPDANFGKAEAAMGVPKLSLVDVAGFYRKAIENAPTNPFFMTSYGEFCLSHGLLPQAEQQYQKAAEVDPENAHLYFSDLALGYFINGLEFMDRQLDMTEEDITRNALRYYLKAFSVDNDRATKLFDRIIEEHDMLTTPDQARSQKECEALLSDDDDGVKDLLKALEDEPNNPITLLSLGQICLGKNRREAGVEYFIKAADMDEENAPFFYNDLSTALYSSSMEEGSKKGEPDEDTLARSLSFALNALGYLDGVRAKELVLTGT
jgi:tetratricopeptide (TPR) repeat protein